MTQTPEQQPTTAAPTPATSQDVPQAEGPQSAAEGVAAQVGLLDDADAFVLPLGAGVRLGPDVLGTDRNAIIPLNALPNIPGLSVTEAKFDRGNDASMIELSGKTAIPLVDEADFTLGFSSSGRPSGFDVTTKLGLEWLDNPDLALRWDPEGGVSCEVTINAQKFVPEALQSHAQTQGDLTLTLSDGKLSGALDTTITVPNLVESHIKGAFDGDGLSAEVSLTNKADWLGDLTGQGAIDANGLMSASITKNAGEVQTPIPGLQFLGGSMSVIVNNDGTISGGISDFHLKYNSVAESTVSFMIDGGHYTGNGTLALTVPGLSQASGTIAMTDGALSGSFELGKDNFPEGMPLKNGSITGSIGPTGALSFGGGVGISLGPLADGDLQASYSEEGGFSIGASFALAVPGLQDANFSIAYDGTDITGEGELAVDPAYLSGIQGAVKITYAEGRWAGETTLGYSADDGKLSGQIMVRVRQAEDDSLKVSGEGDVTAQIAPRLAGTLHAEILEEGGIDVSGEIAVTEPLEMFPEQRFDKELLNISQNIPLWAILVAVLRVRAGVRAGIGPGVFRDIKVTGSYTVGQEGEPSFAISGEMYIPAFVEGYLGFGAGLGASVVLGSLTGGIEAMGTAGIYGAISVIPELAYKDGDYSIEGVATMAAGARLKLSLNAWAEVEALWVTIWENTWELASVTMPVGPNLALQANMGYTFGSPQPPTLDFSTSDIDSDKLIADAMPKDAPPGTGTRDAVKNEARWQGAQRAAGPAADEVPADLADQGEAPSVARPAGNAPPQGAGAPPQSDGQGSGQAGAQPSGLDDPDRPTSGPSTGVDQAAARASREDPNASGTVPPDQAASPDARNYRNLSLGDLDGPPAPTPRTKEQQTEDVKAAAQMVRLVANDVENTDAMDDYFARIKRRFVLGTIGYEIDGNLNIKVRCHINATEDISISERIKGNWPGGDHPKPDFTTSRMFDLGTATDPNDPTKTVTIGATEVATKMVASQLTPLHAQGYGPSDSALRPIWNHIESDPNQSGPSRYIKGHLLNDNLGGPGVSENLFPITHQANSDHKNLIENDAKRLINDEFYWARYVVEIKNINTVRTPNDKSLPLRNYAINADLHADLAILSSSGAAPVPVSSVVVKSRFNGAANAFVPRRGSGASPTDAEKTVRDAERNRFLGEADVTPVTVPGGPPLAAQTNQSFQTQDAVRRDGTLDPTQISSAQQAGLQRQVMDPSNPDHAVLLSREANFGTLILTTPALNLLQDLSRHSAGETAASGTSFSGRLALTTLQKRLEATAGVRGKAGAILNNASMVLAKQTAKPGQNIASDVGSAASTFRILSDADVRSRIRTALNLQATQSAALASYRARRGQMRNANATTKEVLGGLIAAFGSAPSVDRLAVAREFGDYARARDTLVLSQLKQTLSNLTDNAMRRSLNNAL